eukprot:UN29104
MCPYWLTSGLMICVGGFIARKTWLKASKIYAEEDKLKLVTDGNKTVTSGGPNDNLLDNDVISRISQEKVGDGMEIVIKTTDQRNSEVSVVTYDQNISDMFDSQYPLDKMLCLLICWGCVLVSSIFATENVGFMHQKCGTWQYWATVCAPIPILIIVTIYCANRE